ncbi:MAG TPA: MATE family efflux transporter [bacterium]|nr:MATE family efflux transporter [bacterium]
MKSLVNLSLPIIAANVLHSAYQLTDAFWVGRLGAAAIAAISISFPVLFLCASLGGGFAMAGTILVSQYMGKNDLKAVDYISAQTLFMVFMISLVIANIGYLFTPFFISFMGADPEVLTGAISYLKISFAGMIFVFTFMVFQSLMRGVGDVKTPMYIVLGTVLLNFFLDPLFIFGYKAFPPLGVAGAAFATITTQGLAAVVGIFLLLKGRRQIHIDLKDIKPDFPLVRKMFNLGFPASMEQSTVAIGMTALTFLVASFGTVILAAYGIVGRISSFVIIPTIGLSMATSTLVGQNIGAEKTKRASRIVKLAASISFIVLTAVGIAMFFSASFLSVLFAPGETETVRIASQFIRITALTFGFVGIYHVLNGAFIGSGNTMISMILSVITLWILRFPIAFILSRYTSLAERGIWISFPATSIIAAFIAFVWFSRGTWKKKRITEEIKLVSNTTSEAIIEEGISP